MRGSNEWLKSAMVLMPLAIGMVWMSLSMRTAAQLQHAEWKVRTEKKANNIFLVAVVIGVAAFVCALIGSLPVASLQR